MKSISYVAKLFLLTVVLLANSGCSQASDYTPSTDKYRNYYEIFVRSFYDSNEDGTGDLNGVVKKLDYLNDGNPKTNSDLGIDGIWLMPIMPSPTYHKYDVTDYYDIDPQYGSMKDFENFITQCNSRGIKVIIDLVLNHTSTKHPWFTEAVKSLAIEPCGKETCESTPLCREHSPYVKYYNFTKEVKGKGYYNIGMPEGWYYQGVFWDGMPDLNLDDENLKAEILKISKFWIDKGVGGFRLDAVLHFFDENVEKNVSFLSWFYNESKKLKSDIYMVGEAWTDNETIARYYESGIDSFFNFSFSGQTGEVISKYREKSGSGFTKAAENWQKKILSANPKAIDATFLSNHDNARSAGFLMRNLEGEKMCAAMYLLLPGNSFIYYGEEIGMTGSGKDENKRQPMEWSISKTEGEAFAVTGTDQKQDLTAGVDEQLKDKNSLLSYYKKIIRLKNENPEISRGTVTPMETENGTVSAYSVSYNESIVYIYHNLSDSEVEVALPPNATSKYELKGSLETNKSKVKLANEKLIMPAYSTAILK